MPAPRLTLSAAALAAACLLAPAAAAQSAPPQITKKAPGRVAVIDMAEVFANYDKFEDVRKQLEAEIEASSGKSKEIIGRMQKLQQELQSGTFKQDSPEYLQRAADLNKLQTDLKVEQTTLSGKFMKKEAENYKAIYDEVQKMVKVVCERSGYTMVIRYRQDGPQAGGPQEVLQNMNRLVVYTAPEDDITDIVIYGLDNMYSRKTGKPARDQKAEAKKTAAAGPPARK